MLDMDVVVVGAQSYVEGTALRSLHEKMSGVALVLLASVVREEDVMRQFDSVINIYDNPQQVAKKLNSAIEQSQTNP